jgi:phage-related minor tail protein
VTTLTFDLMARDKSFSSTLIQGGKAGDTLAKKIDAAGKDISSGLEQSFKKAGKSGIYLERSADGSVRAFDTAAKRIRKDFDGVEDAGKKVGKGVTDGLGDALSGLSGGGGPISGIVDQFDGMFSSLKGGALAAGVAVGGTLLAAFDAAFDQKSVGATIAAKIGGAAGDVGRLGGVAGDVYADNFGESMQDVGDSITAVFQNKLIDTNASDAAIEHLTESAMTASQVVGEEVNAIGRSARQLLVNDLAGNVDQAFDLIVGGSQKGLNAAGDLLDTVDEYAPKFRELGLSGQESMGLLSQAMDAGARNTDIAADALKELSIRAIDGSAITRRGFETIGLDANKMAGRFAAGGATANQALQDTLNALEAMPPGTARATAAVDLFGTKAEDMGSALYHMDLDSAAQEMDGFAGSLQEAANRMNEGVSGADKLGRGFHNMLSDIGNAAFAVGNWGNSDALDESAEKIQLLKAAMADFKSTGSTEYFDQLKAKFPEMSGSIDQIVSKLEKESSANANVAASVQAHVDTLDELIDKQKQAAGITLDVREAESAFQAAIDDATGSIKKNGKAHGFATEKGRENNAALDDIAKTALTVAAAMSTDGASADSVGKKMASARDQFMSTARQMGYTKTEAAALATKLGLIRGNYNAQVRALGIAAAKASVQGLINRLDNIPRSVNVMVNVHGNEMAARGLPIGGHQQRASGGPVKANSLYRVGEEGEEWFVPNQNGMIIPHDVVANGAAALSPFGPGGSTTRGSSKTDVHMHIHGSSTLAEAIKADVRTGKIRFQLDAGGRVIVA